MRAVHKEAAERYTAAVNDVNVTGGKSTKEEYDRLRSVADKAKAARNAAQQALNDHKKSHGC